MAIDINEFEEAPGEALDLQEGTQPYKILMFLLENPNHAFATEEIASEAKIAMDTCRTVLHRLLDRDLVRHRGRYWALGEDDRLASYAAQTAASSASTTDDYYG
jgi:response regulator of citrate/malate metabolism